MSIATVVPTKNTNAAEYPEIKPNFIQNDFDLLRSTPLDIL